MRQESSRLYFSATDLSEFSGCRRATLLYREVAFGNVAAPHLRNDPAMRLLEERGKQHEARYREQLEAQMGEPLVAIVAMPPKTESEWQQAVRRTLEVMQAGPRFIYQAALADGAWRGCVDFLERVDHAPGEEASALGAYHYRAVDTKLAQAPRASAILQLCVYSELLARLQGKLPEHLVVVNPEGAPGGELAAELFRTADYAAYFRQIRRRLQDFVEQTPAEGVYPEACEQCDICRWWPVCNQRRRDDDHLSFVAGMTRRAQRLLEGSGVGTLAALGKLHLPMSERPKKLREESLSRLQHQAALQLTARESTPGHELLLPPLERKGLNRLPVPDAGDVFFDVEVDRYAAGGSFVYLFGWVERDAAGKLTPHALWANTRAEEKRNFEQFVDHVRKRRETFPDLHIYHFAHLERTLLSELAGSHATREQVVDDWLREDVLCDLLAIVKQALRAGVETYSLKDLEQFYKYVRQTDLREAAESRRWFELLREGGTNDLAESREVIEGYRAVIEHYNREDCESTAGLCDWLEALRVELVAQGHSLARPGDEAAAAEPEDKASHIKEWEAQVARLRGRLLQGVAPEPAPRSPGQEARRLLADVLDWHRRKESPTWREYFRTQRLTADECFEETGPIGLLGPEQDRGKEKKSRLYAYDFPPQEHKIKKGDKVECPVTGAKLGEVFELDRAGSTIVVKRTQTLEQPPTAIIVNPSPPKSDALQNALAKIAESLADNDFGLDVADDDWGAPQITYPAARALLLRSAPQLLGNTPLRKPGESASAAAVRVAPLLDKTLLAIQGPPGAGKTHTASRMILELLRAGKRVGITGPSHKVIGNLLEKVHNDGAGSNVAVRSLQKVAEIEQGVCHDANALATASGAALKKQLEEFFKDGGQIIAGTQFFFAGESLQKPLDVLFIDEAGQFSLANALAVSVAAHSLVLLGDPQQLAQPDEGSHPPGAGASALEHVLGGEATIAPERGIFLDETWRLPPAIAAFTSRYFYAGKLQTNPDCAKQRLLASGDAARFDGSGVFFERVSHSGNVNTSEEEATHIAGLVRALLTSGTQWTNRAGETSALTVKDILIVAPYNLQVQCIAATLGVAGIDEPRVGTVDKFQGQEAPVVIYSMATSSPEDAPRGFEFLFELERLNVATSRAQAVVIVVASPALLEAECKTPRQMRLVNALCGAVEAAE